MLSRRSFVSVCGLGFLTTAQRMWAAISHTRVLLRTPHPKPRPGITGAKVLTAAQLNDHPNLVPLFDSVRKIPQIIDGIRCNCGCGHPPEMYSLLSCYEGEAMARECAVCQGQGRLAARLHTEGKTLAEIRVALDAKFG